MTELSDLSRRNDELMTAKDSDMNVIRELDAQLKEYKRKYEQAKTEVRSMKGQCISPPPNFRGLNGVLLHSDIAIVPASSKNR